MGGEDKFSSDFHQTTRTTNMYKSMRRPMQVFHTFCKVRTQLTSNPQKMTKEIEKDEKRKRLPSK